MRPELKASLEEIASLNIKQVQSLDYIPKRIVIGTSCDVPNKTLVLNYTENSFLNIQFVIGNKIATVVSSTYTPKRDKVEGDWFVDVGKFLQEKLLTPSAYSID
ncbi:MAG: hypothetical protein WCX73_03375 [Candidatus Pacearchaeota archaeon]|jgi:hypothetical protein